MSSTAPIPSVPAVTSNTPASGKEEGTGEGCNVIWPVALILIEQLSCWPLVEVTRAVLAIEAVPATATVVRNDFDACVPPESDPILQVTVRLPEL
jgi:hypothetical protein